MGPSRPPSSVVVVVDGPVMVGFGGFGLVVFVGRVVVVVVDGVVVVVAVVVVVVDGDGRGSRLVLVLVTGTGATGAVVVVVCTGACWPWKSAVIGWGILTNAMPSTTPAIADTTSAVLALITRSNEVLAARSTLCALLRLRFSSGYAAGHAEVQPDREAVAPLP
jgi:hypothetical protein